MNKDQEKTVEQLKKNREMGFLKEGQEIIKAMKEGMDKYENSKNSIEIKEKEELMNMLSKNESRLNELSGAHHFTEDMKVIF